MYRSPIEILMTDIQHQIAEQQDEKIYQAVVSVSINVAKDELIRALKYDRDQYQKGYADGVADATPKWIPVEERLPTAEDADKAGDVLVYCYSGCAGVWSWDDVKSHTNLIGYWMPLPEPPKGE